jgi:hypothetical protein
LEQHVSELQILESQLDDGLRKRYKELEAVKNKVDMYDGKFNTLSLAVDEMEQRLNDLAIINQQLESEKQSYHSELEALQAEVSSIQAKHAVAIRNHEQILENYRQKEDTEEQKLAALGVEQVKRREHIRQAEFEHELIRKDLAARERAAIARDKNLRVREVKVSNDERSIQQNAELLNL